MDFRVFSRNISENMHARCVREDTKQALKGNLQADGVQSRQTLFVRYCPKAILNKACSTAFPNSHEIITKCARILQKDVVCYCHHEKTAGICFPRFRQIPRRVFQHTAQRGVCIWKNPKSPKNHGSHTG